MTSSGVWVFRTCSGIKSLRSDQIQPFVRNNRANHSHCPSNVSTLVEGDGVTDIRTRLLDASTETVRKVPSACASNGSNIGLGKGSLPSTIGFPFAKTRKVACGSMAHILALGRSAWHRVWQVLLKDYEPEDRNLQAGLCCEKHFRPDQWQGCRPEVGFSKFGLRRACGRMGENLGSAERSRLAREGFQSPPQNSQGWHQDRRWNRFGWIHTANPAAIRRCLRPQSRHS